MALVKLDVPTDVAPLPRKVAAFLTEVDLRIDRFAKHGSVHAFVPSDYVLVYGVLRSLAARSTAPGNAFCEWGCGMGVVAGLATMLGYEACGIEINAELIDEARALAEDFDLSIEYSCGNLIPTGGGHHVDGASLEMAWLEMGGHDAYDELGLDADDFDMIFAYPWPGEEEVINDLFEHYAAVGAVLVTFHGIEDVRVQRKIS